MKSFFIFGNHPFLSLAELKSVLPDLNTEIFFKNILVTEKQVGENEKVQNQTGGIVKSGEVIFEAENENSLIEDIKIWINKIPINYDEKIVFGVSFIGNFSFTFQRKIKEKTKSSLKFLGAKSIRFVDNKQNLNLSAATLKFNNILKKGFDLVLIKEKKLYCGITKSFQNIDEWNKKDFERPKRDTVHGLIQPKLARMMINLAKFSNYELKNILDPFCGSGTIVQEAMDLGIKGFGSDIDEGSVSYSRINLKWFSDWKDVKFEDSQVFLHDAKRNFPENFNGFFDAIITEPFMGKQLQKPLTEEEFFQTSKFLVGFYHKTFGNFYDILKKSGKVVFAFPATKVGKIFKFLRFEEKLKEKGFEIIEPKDYLNFSVENFEVSKRGFVFGRENQLVKREIVVFEKI
jgi:tRNA G10  N-methylase Trm11